MGEKLTSQECCDENISHYLMQEGKYAEAKAILADLVPKVKHPPFPGQCGVPYQHYEHLKEMLTVCESKTTDTKTAPALREVNRVPLSLIIYQTERV
jgi:hypothetical protein